MIRRTSRRGGNAIEFALTLPLFLAVIVGLMDYGFLFAMQAGIDNAVSLSCREGAMVDPGFDPTGPATIAASQLDIRSALFCTGVTCTKTAEETGELPPNRTLRCEIVRPMRPLIGFLPASMFPTSINSVSFYRFEWQRPPT
jgi:hypothetical protein